jgi:hypothetical protein
MKPFLFIFLFSVLAINSFAQTEIGSGLIEIHFDDKTVLEFYEKPFSSKPTKKIEFFNDEKINSWNIRNLEKQKKWLNPESLWLDYHSFIFRCVARQKDWYKVIVNNENNKTLWIRKQKFTEFKTWEQFLKSIFGIERLKKQKIRRRPSENSGEIKYKGKDCFQVRRLKGAWIEIFSADYCDEDYTDSKTPIKSGWIKWRTGNKLLINYFITS